MHSDTQSSELHPHVQDTFDEADDRESAGALLWRDLESDTLESDALEDALPFMVDAKSTAHDDLVLRLARRLRKHAWNRSSRIYLREITKGRDLDEREDVRLRGFLELCRTKPRHDRHGEEMTRMLSDAFARRDDFDLLVLARQNLPASVFSRLSASAAASESSCIEATSQLRVAMRSALADEAVQIVLRINNPDLYDMAWSALDERREEMALALLGDPLSLVERMFGPSFREFFLGATGLMGFAGIASLVFTMFFVWMTPIGLQLSLTLFVVLFLGIRPLLVRDIKPRFAVRDLLDGAIRPASAGLLLSWACRHRLESGHAPRVVHVIALTETLDGAPAYLLERARVVASVIDRDIVHTAARRERPRLIEAVETLGARLDRERRMLVGVSHQDPRLVASALRQRDSYDAAVRALARAPGNSELLDAVLEALEENDETALWHYALRAQIGEVRHVDPDENQVQMWDNALATIARVSKLQGRNLGVRLVWTTGTPCSVEAQRTLLELVARESRTAHSVALFDLAAQFTPESKARTLESLDEQPGRFLVALLGDDSTLFVLGEEMNEDASLLLRRNAGPAAALGLWRIANTSPSASDRRHAWKALEELAERYGFGIFELIDESVASVRRLENSEWQMLATSRLEEAMVGRRRWTTRAWRRAVGRPEILEHAQGLVWASFDLYDRIIGTFRIDESLELVNLHHEPWQLQGHQRIGLPAASDLDPRLLTEWSELFADFEIVAPFDQLSRHTGEVPELPAHSFEGLQSKGWLASHPDDGRVFSFLRPFLELGATALIEIEPGIARDRDETQRVTHLSFVDGIHFEEPAVPIRADEESDPSSFSAARDLLEEDLARAIQAPFENE